MYSSLIMAVDQVQIFRVWDSKDQNVALFACLKYNTVVIKDNDQYFSRSGGRTFCLHLKQGFCEIKQKLI